MVRRLGALSVASREVVMLSSLEKVTCDDAESWEGHRLLSGPDVQDLVMKAAPRREPVLPATRSSWRVLVLSAVLVGFLAAYVLTRSAAGSYLLVVSNDTSLPAAVALCSDRACPERQLGTVASHGEQGFSARVARPVVVVVSGATPRCERVLTSSGPVVIRVSVLRSCADLGVEVPASSTGQAGPGVPASKTTGHP
jgi:hypothetical protein